MTGNPRAAGPVAAGIPRPCSGLERVAPVLTARGRSRVGRVASAVAPDARRADAGDAKAIVEEAQRRRRGHAAATRRAPGV